MRTLVCMDCFVILNLIASGMQGMHTLMRIRGLSTDLEKACHGLGYIIESVAM